MYTKERSIDQRERRLRGFALILVLLTVTLMVMGSLAHVDAKKKKKTNPKLNYKTLSLCKYHSGQLQVNNSKKTPVWASSDPQIVSVTDTGLVTANASGACQITAKVGKKTLKCSVTVTDYDKYEVLAGYGWMAADQLLGKSSPVKINSVCKGKLMDSKEYAYLALTYKDAAGADRQAYVYIYEKDLPEQRQAYFSNSLYGNLIMRVDVTEMDSLTKDLSSPLDLSVVTQAYTSLKTHETVSVQKGSTFDEFHASMNIS